MPARAPWEIAAPAGEAVDALVRELGVSPLVAVCLANRAHADPAAARRFLEPRLGDLAVPDGMADLPAAARRVAAAVSGGELVGVFGDYDVDGVTSAALVTTFLDRLGCRTATQIASRFTGGYGLSTEAVERFGADGCTLLIALDCGSSDHQAVELAAARGIDVVIIDHHRVDGRHPAPALFVNPQRADCAFADKSLAAVGLAFYFCAALRAQLVRDGQLDRASVDPRGLLDFVALGTIADVVPLVGNNRILAAHGLRLISTAPRPGLRALIRRSNIRATTLRAEHVTYQLAPRLNAAGRLASAQQAYEALMATETTAAAGLAERLEELTQERRAVEDEVARQARAQAEDPSSRELPVTIASGDGWHRGVIGIVAARLGEEFGKPAFVVGFDGEIGIGSARGQGQLNLHRCLSAGAGLLERFGGHRDAAGFTVRRERFAELRAVLIAHASAEIAAPRAAALVCDARLEPAEVTAALVEDLARLGPFGNGNPEPVFEVGDLQVVNSRVVGGDHLKLEVRAGGGVISAFGPRLGRAAREIAPRVRVAATVGNDEWRGDGTPELRLVRAPVPVG